MSKKRRGDRQWRRSGSSLSAGDIARGLGITAVIVVLALAGIILPQRSGAAQETPQIIVSRAMASNPELCYPVNDAYYDWIELANLGHADVNLEGWRLADDMDLRGAFAFGDVTLPAGGTLIVYCSDRPEDAPENAIFCGFRLNSEGELLVLADANQLPVQTLKLPASGKKDILLRQSDGSFVAVDYAAMLAANPEPTPEPVDLTPPYRADALRINEVMAVNRTTLTDADGEFSDWIELYNGGAAAVDLTGWTLSDDDADPARWTFPSVAIQPGEYLLVFASGKERPGSELHASFGLSAQGEVLRLYGPDGAVVSWIEYLEAEPDVSLSRDGEDGALTDQLPPTPGYENSAEAEAEAARRLTQNAQNLYINEIMATGKGSDWAEIYNGSGAAIDLSGMGLSDDVRHPRKWQFPDGAQVAAGAYAVVYLNREGALPEGGESGYVANFALSAGETLCLSLSDGRIIDRVRLGLQYRDVSYGRAANRDVYRCFAEATPGAVNAEQSYEKKAQDVIFSCAGGAHAESELMLEMTSDDDVPIYYTLDGSAPSTSSKVYSGPIRLTSNSMVRARAWRPDVIPSSTTTRSFILNAQHTVRVVCVTGSRSKLNGSTGALNTGAKGNGCDVYAEIYEPDGTLLVGQNCHFELLGHGSRYEMAQKGFRLQSQKRFGEGWFEAALFSNRDYDEYKSVVLRASGQDALQTHMRDSILTSLAADTSLMYQECEVTVVYVNGQYWGVYNLRERVCDESIAQFEGWENPDAINLLEGAAKNAVYAVQGSAEGYHEIMRWVRNNDLSKDANVTYLEQYVDVDNYLDYVAMQIYTCNLDLDNLRLYNNPSEGGRWRWIFYDQDLSYQVDRNNVADWLRSGGVGTITSQDNTLFRKLMQNDGVRDRFLTRLGELLRTTCSAENVTAKITARYELLEPEMALNCKRWGWSTETWKKYCKNMLNYANKRPEKLKQYVKSSFKLSDAQMAKYFGD